MFLARSLRLAPQRAYFALYAGHPVAQEAAAQGYIHLFRRVHVDYRHFYRRAPLAHALPVRPSPANARAHWAFYALLLLGLPARSQLTGSPSFRRATSASRLAQISIERKTGRKLPRARCAGYTGVHSYTGMFPFFVGFRIKDYLFTENQ